MNTSAGTCQAGDALVDQLGTGHRLAFAPPTNRWEHKHDETKHNPGRPGTRVVRLWIASGFVIPVESSFRTQHRRADQSSSNLRIAVLLVEISEIRIRPDARRHKKRMFLTERLGRPARKRIR